MVLSPEAKQKQTYGCFEMVSPPRKQLYINRKMNFKISAIPWFRLNFKLFYDREKEPRSDAEANFGLRQSAGILPCKPKSGTFSLREKSGTSPRAPLFLLALYLDQKMG